MSASRKSFNELAALGKLEVVEIDDCGYLVFEQAAREQRRVTRIGRQLTVGTDQQHVHGFTQACKFAFIVQDDGLDAGTFGDKPQQPRLAAARIRLDEKARVDQRWQVTFQLPAVRNLSDDHRLFPDTHALPRAVWFQACVSQILIVTSLPALAIG